MPNLQCPFCGKSVPNKRHQVLCPKRPGRPLGNSKGGGKRGPRTVRQEPVIEAGQTILEAAPEPVAEADLPNFEAIPEPGQAPPPAQGEAPGPQIAQDAIFWDSIVSFLCDGFDVAVKGQIGDKPQAPEPPASVSPEDREKLAQALASAMGAYGGSAAAFLSKWGPAINLAFVSGAIFLPRVMQAREYVKYRQAAELGRRRALAKANGHTPNVLHQAPEPNGDLTDVGEEMIRKQAQRVHDLNPEAGKR